MVVIGGEPKPEPVPMPKPIAQRPTSPSLKGRRAAFVREYLQDLNATAAYIRAGYKDTPAANKHAHRLLKDPQVQAALADFEAKANETAIVNVKRLEERLDRMAHADIRKLFNLDNTLKLPTEWDDVTAAAVASLVVEERTYADADGKMVTVRLKHVVMVRQLEALLCLIRRLELAEQASRAHAAPAHAVGPRLTERIDALAAEFEQADAALAQRARDEISAALGCVPAESRLADNSARAGSTHENIGPSTSPTSVGASQIETPKRHTAAPPVHAEPADVSLFLGKPCGPFTRAQVQAMLDAGTATLDTPSFRKVTDVWVPLRKLLGITSTVAAAQGEPDAAQATVEKHQQRTSQRTASPAAGPSAGDDYWSPGPGQTGAGSAGVGHRGLGVPPQRRGA
jgi:phage terminase small subunit